MPASILILSLAKQTIRGTDPRDKNDIGRILWIEFSNVWIQRWRQLIVSINNRNLLVVNTDAGGGIS